MKIVDVVTERFRYKSRRARDSEGHSHPGPERDATECVLKIVTDDGAEGYSFGANEEVIQGVARPALIGEDPFFREKICQHLFGYVHVSQRPGLGQDINWDYIREHRVTR